MWAERRGSENEVHQYATNLRPLPGNSTPLKTRSLFRSKAARRRGWWTLNYRWYQYSNVGRGGVAWHWRPFGYCHRVSPPSQRKDISNLGSISLSLQFHKISETSRNPRGVQDDWARLLQSMLVDGACLGHVRRGSAVLCRTCLRGWDQAELKYW